ncbi:hypothetical protein PAXRUDRAFT_139681 [Paxillus rubicundulus Ve08.2h10]|uniref:Uncharacterized protein n=1 Tax=Paxillus rubicundulus Ve08.2h10 TaxID=930991 RepID=A0A0D0E475_9AGAM|nr:hypothetical protein PAXRUDRAFT_139681 [Paxillus rubicundulus Ve08.2h10]
MHIHDSDNVIEGENNHIVDKLNNMMGAFWLDSEGGGGAVKDDDDEGLCAACVFRCHTTEAMWTNHQEILHELEGSSPNHIDNEDIFSSDDKGMDIEDNFNELD